MRGAEPSGIHFREGDTINGMKEIESQTTKQGGRISDSQQPKSVEYEREAEPSGIHFREGDTINGMKEIESSARQNILFTNTLFI